MRIAFVGKGGSGKTTLAALFCRHLAEAGERVLAIDADINQHLGTLLGMTPAEAERMPALSDDLLLIKEWLRGTNPRIRSAAEMIKTTPPGTGSRLLRLGTRNPVFSTFARRAGGTVLLAAGAFGDEDVGTRCYHSKTGAVELVLNHLVDGPGEYVVVDMTAGADAFASGLFAAFDLTVLVVEPTRQSVAVYGQYARHAAAHGVSFAVVANKAESPEDEAYVRSQVDGRLLAVMGRSAHVRSLEREGATSGVLEAENAKALHTIRGALDCQKKDWDAYQRMAAEMHRKNAMAWGNASMGFDLREQIDEGFSLAAHA